MVEGLATWAQEVELTVPHVEEFVGAPTKVQVVVGGFNFEEVSVGGLTKVYPNDVLSP